MAHSVKTYQKLPGSKKGFLIGKHTLWQGKDHLLYIFSRFGVEDYKRFYFNDIQAIITRKTIVGKIQNIVLGCFILMFLVPVFFFGGGWSIFYAVVCGMMVLFLLINLYKGPTCETRLLTAVQTERLHSLSRLKIAGRVMDRVRPFIQLAQGTLKPEDLNKIPVRPAERKAHGGPGATVAGRETGRVHMILFGLLLFDGVLAAMEFFITHVIPTVLGSVAGMGIGICVILALVKQHNSNLPASLRAITWTCLGLVCANFAVGYIIGIGFAMRNPRIAYNQWEVFKSLSSISPWESPLMMSLNFMAIGGALFLGIPGLIILLRSEKKVKKPAARRSSTPGSPVISRKTETI